MPTMPPRTALSPRWAQQGFTLIELIVVIVILGVLAATALPKFLNISNEARVGVVTRARVEVAGAANLAYAKCLVVPDCVAAGKGTGFNGPDGRFGYMYNGYPTGQLRTGTWGFFGIKEWVNVSGFTVVEVNTSVTEFRLTNATDPTNCLVRYTETGTLGTPPTTIIVTTGC